MSESIAREPRQFARESGPKKEVSQEGLEKMDSLFMASGPDSNVLADDGLPSKDNDHTRQLKSIQAAANSSTQVQLMRQNQAAANASPQVQAAMQRKQSLEQAQPAIQRKENKTGLPDELKSGIENLGGYSMDDVKVHYNSDKPAQMKAHAYAQGTDIHIAPGQEQHLAHEAWHVVQQKQGRVKATTQLKGIGINDDTSLEKEADVMGAKAMQMKGKNENGELKGGTATGIAMQRVGKVGEQPESFADQLASRMQQMWSEAGLPDNNTCEMIASGKMVELGGATRPLNGNITQFSHLLAAAIHDALPNFSPDPATFMQHIGVEIVNVSQQIGDPFDLPTVIKYLEAKANGVVTTMLKDKVAAKNNDELNMAMDGLRIPYDKAGQGKFDLMASNFEAQSDIDVSAPFRLSKRMAGQLSSVLKGMPVVKDILSGEIGNLDHKKMDKKRSQAPEMLKWIAPKIVEEDEGALNSSVVKKVKLAMAKIVNMVDPKILQNLPVPKVVVHKNVGLLEALRQGNLKNWKDYRANSSRDLIQIDIAENESDRVIVHEIGHQLEYFLPTEHWMNIQKLLRGRHAEAGGDGNLESIYPNSRNESVRKEPAYKSKNMPATGKYSMKHYVGGATEVFSMSMEYFSDPKDALKLIENDPLQALIILDAIAPGDVSDHLPMEFFDLLPNRFKELEDM